MVTFVANILPTKIITSLKVETIRFVGFFGQYTNVLVMLSKLHVL